MGSSSEPSAGRAAALASPCSCSCTDPVRDQQIERLGGEDPRVPPGPEHRPGQPCVLCHSDGGPASDLKFAIAGTIFETSSPESNGAEGVKVFFIDAASAHADATRRTPPATSSSPSPSGPT